MPRFALPQDGAFPFGGMNTIVPATMLDPNFGTLLYNTVVEDGIVQKRSGYFQLGDNLESTPVVHLTEFETYGGVKQLLAFTTTKVYKYDATLGTWVVQSGSTAWTGNEDDTVQSAVGTDLTNRRLLVTNGKDIPKIYDGSTLGDWTPSGLQSTWTAKTVCVYADHAIVGNVESGSSNPFTIVWSNVGDYTDMQEGTSGSLLIGDSMGEIWKLLPLGDRVAIYSENSTGFLLHIGGQAVFAYERMAQQTRLAAPNAVVSINPYHFVASQENFYLWDGSRLMRPIGNAIKDRYRRDLFVGKVERLFAHHDVSRQTVYWVIPTSATTSLVYRMEYDVFDIANVKWSIIDPTDRWQSVAFYTRDTTQAWDDGPLVTWDDWAGVWDEEADREGFPVRVFGSEGKVYIDDESSFKDDDATFSTIFESKDFVVPQEYRAARGRWVGLEVEMRGSTAQFEYSTNGGTKYVVAGSKTFTTEWERYQVWFDVSGETFRWRITTVNSTDTYKLRWYRVLFYPSGAGKES